MQIQISIDERFLTLMRAALAGIGDTHTENPGEARAMAHAVVEFYLGLPAEAQEYIAAQTDIATGLRYAKFVAGQE